MLSLDFMCEHPERVREALRQRRNPSSIDELLALATQRNNRAKKCEELRGHLAQLKETPRTISAAQQTNLDKQIQLIGKEIRQLERQMDELTAHLQPLLLGLPNLPHGSVPQGDGPAGNNELRLWGEPITFSFHPLTHWDLGKRLHLIDSEAGTRVAGSRFVALKGLGARLERALISFMLDLHIQEHTYTEWILPSLAKRSVMLGAGQLPLYEDQTYACSEDELYLTPSAEVPLLGMYSDTVLPAETLPQRSVAWTTAFRREAGAARQPRGLLRLHQFNQVELFQLVAPEHSYAALEQMLAHAEAVLRHLELPYRVVMLCAANLPFASAKTLALEVWMPAMGRYVEISSISNYEAFQARRANVRYRRPNTTRAEYVHTLSASALAISRTMAALLESYQQADGTVIVPKVLRPYMRASLLSP